MTVRRDAARATSAPISARGATGAPADRAAVAPPPPPVLPRVQRALRNAPRAYMRRARRAFVPRVKRVCASPPRQQGAPLFLLTREFASNGRAVARLRLARRFFRQLFSTAPRHRPLRSLPSPPVHIFASSNAFNRSLPASPPQTPHPQTTNSPTYTLYNQSPFHSHLPPPPRSFSFPSAFLVVFFLPPPPFAYGNVPFPTVFVAFIFISSLPKVLLLTGSLLALVPRPPLASSRIPAPASRRSEPSRTAEPAVPPSPTPTTITP